MLHVPYRAHYPTILIPPVCPTRSPQVTSWAAGSGAPQLLLLQPLLLQLLLLLPPALQLPVLLQTRARRHWRRSPAGPAAPLRRIPPPARQQPQ